MTRNGKGGLNHHEELRYYYLLRHLTYLSDGEKREFRYLKAKLEQGQTALTSDSSAAYSQRPKGSRKTQDDPFADFEADDTAGYTPKGIMAYPTEQKRSSRHKKQPAAVAQPKRTRTFVTPAYDSDDGSPRTAKKGKRKYRTYFKWLAWLLFLVFLGMVFMFVKGIFDVSHSTKDVQPAIKETFHGQDTKDGTNILVLGSDQRVTQQSTDARTDTIMVINVGNKSQKMKMVSFMRDTLINIPGYSYSDESYDLKLNSSFNFGEQDKHQGAEFVRKALKRNFDIDCKYYVMVDFEIFAQAIDTLFPNGVKINAKFATINGTAVDHVEVPDDLRMKNGVVPDQTIKVGEQRMDGRTLLNYARFRKDDQGDYGRTVRQQQVMSAVMQQIKDPSKLFTGSAAIGKIYALTSTNLSFPFIAHKGLSSVTAGKGVERVTIPQNGDWVDEYDMYGGQALAIDYAKYQDQLAQLGLR
ncbi:MAG: LytR family transcriptional regulator [Streptococcus pyogenes]|nr:MAG: LytR family transcriptional regulator [Streptococcus pyogenes]